MNIVRLRLLTLSVVCLFLIPARQGHGQSDGNLTSPVTTLKEFQKHRALGDQAESLTEKAKHWRLALTWQSKHVEWLRLARTFAGKLRNAAHDPNDPRHKEFKSIYREILHRFNHMEFYTKRGADSYWNDSLSLPVAACIGLRDYPRFLDMIQDFQDRRVRDWLAEPVPVKRTASARLFESRHKRISYEQRVANWLDRRRLASEGQVLSRDEIRLIDLAVKQHAYRCRGADDDHNPVPGLSNLGTRYTAPAILAAIHKQVKAETPPLPRFPARVGKIIERTIHGKRFGQAIGPAKVDFDTGIVATNDLEWSNRKQQSVWMSRGGLDIVVDYHWKDLMRIIAFGFRLIEVPGTTWDDKSGSWEQLETSEIKKGALLIAHRGGDQMQYSILANTRLPVTFAFGTREGGVGLLQLTAMKEPARNVREYSIRYRLNKAGQIGR